MKTGLTFTNRITIREEHTAITLGSGDMPVLATPILVALMENAAMKAVAGLLPAGSTTVGGYIQTTHIKPTGTGHTVETTATLVKVDGRKLTFNVEARDELGKVGEGEHIRFIVDRDKFMTKI
ncbi:MAG: thioesterase family protein [Clostridium sp.]|nr:thioesterase family protein [Clostridium sp.]